MNGGLRLATVDSWESIKGLWLMSLINGELKRGFSYSLSYIAVMPVVIKCNSCKNNQHYWHMPDPL